MQQISQNDLDDNETIPGFLTIVESLGVKMPWLTNNKFLSLLFVFSVRKSREKNWLGTVKY